MITRNILPASKSVLDGNWSRWEFGTKRSFFESSQNGLDYSGES